MARNKIEIYEGDMLLEMLVFYMYGHY